MTVIDESTLKQLAKLAGLEITDAATLQSIQNSLNKVFELFQDLKEVDTQNVQALKHPLDLIYGQQTIAGHLDSASTPWHTTQLEVIQQQSQEHDVGLYLVPKVID